MTTVVSVAQGGTGSNNATAARSSLGAAPLAAYDAANNAYSAANTASSTGGGGYAQANAAYAQANAAYNNSNTRLSTSGGSISGDLAITGNLTVQGNATTINVSNLSVNDSMILLSTNAVGDSNDIGFIGHFDRGPTATHAGLIRKATQNQFYLFDNYEVEPTNNVIDVAGNNFTVGNLRLGIINANSYVTSAGLNVTDQANAAYSQANAAYGAANNRVLKSGDTMTGELVISAATPSIRFTDTDNGADAYVQGTDGNLRLFADDNSEAASSFIGLYIDGSERFRVANTGSVGIGTVNPTRRLDAYDSTADSKVMIIRRGAQGNEPSLPNAFGKPYLQIGGQEYQGNSLQSIGFGYVIDSTNNPPGEIGFKTITTSGYTYGDFVIGTRAVTTDTAVTERFRITYDGNVGIGTTSPSNKLEVDGGSSSTRLRVSTTNNGTGVAGIILSNSSKSAFNDGVEIAHGGGYTTVNDLSGNNLMTFACSSTRVGVGTTNPSYKLDAYAPNSGINIGGSNSRLYFGGNRALEGSQDGTLLQIGEGYTTTRIYGSVGIGTNTAFANGTVSLRGTTNKIVLSSSNYTTSQYLTSLGVRNGAEAFLIFGNNGQNEIRAGHYFSGGYLDFYANNTLGQESASDGNFVARMHANGSVSIGTATMLGDSTHSLTVYSQSGRGVVSKANTSDYTFLSLSPQNKGYGFYHSTGNTFILREVAVVDAMQVNPGGRINFPAQPAFSTSGTNYTQGGLGVQSVVIPNSMLFNVGSHYNASTGVFTAPVAGKYYFAFWGLAYPLPENDRISIRYRKNGTEVVVVEHNGNSGSHTETSGAIFLELAANDTVDLTFRRDAGTSAYAYTTQWTMMGYLVC